MIRCQSSRQFSLHSFNFQYFSDQAAMDLMKHFLCRSPESRIGCSIRGFQEVKEHDFFRGFKWDALLGMECTPPLIPSAETYDVDSEDGDHSKMPDPIDVTGVGWEK